MPYFIVSERSSPISAGGTGVRLRAIKISCNNNPNSL
eukprot:CAMPEP_0115239414 /NCGR_PEP_ID=MMETSP0270-20121206/37388_1 /TAXON_ID=71861 /ORGANISM="Scrippsiella trochoidea, Strain CCMP3099" /LENGTH=36 /DNA_ID= /DNA_START= /DNA_END= /DNA_ORIENTATION=